MSKVPGVNYVTKSQRCCLSYDHDPSVEKAIMPCSHAVSTELMVEFLNFVVSSKSLQIICPVKNDATGKPCLKEWPYDLCKRVAILSKSE